MLSTADERFDGRQGKGCIVALMGSVQREEDLVINTAESAKGELLAPDGDLTAQNAELVAVESWRCATSWASVIRISATSAPGQR